MFLRMIDVVCGVFGPALERAGYRMIDVIRTFYIYYFSNLQFRVEVEITTNHKNCQRAKVYHFTFSAFLILMECGHGVCCKDCKLL